MKIKFYPKHTNHVIQAQTMCGRDSNGSYYLLDVEHISPLDVADREHIDLITWNNVDFNKESHVRDDAEKFFEGLKND